MLTKLTVPYDLFVCVPISLLLTMGSCPFSIVLTLYAF